MVYRLDGSYKAEAFELSVNKLLKGKNIKFPNKADKKIHLYAREIRTYYHDWQKKYENRMSFEHFLQSRVISKMSDRKIINLFQKTVTYLHGGDRKKYAASFRNKKIVVNKRVLKDGTYMCVLSEHGKLYVGKKKKGTFHHSSFVAGRPVKTAGRVKIKDGKIRSIDNFSGHYKPSKESLHKIVDFLKKSSRMGSAAKKIPLREVKV